MLAVCTRVGSGGSGRRLPVILAAAFIWGLAWLAPSSAFAQTIDAEGIAAPDATEATHRVESAGSSAKGPLRLESAAVAGRENAPSAGILAGRPTVRPARVNQAPSIDGRLDDAAWRTAGRITEFVQQRPLEGNPATEQTEVYLAHDNENLYFGIYARYSDPALIRANHADRDRTENDDTVTIFFDPFLDQQSGYSLSVNGYGVQGDSVLTNRSGAAPGGTNGNNGQETGNQGDKSWNALFRSAGQLVEDGWTAEMAIPFKSLRYPARSSDQIHRWGFQIQREIQSKDESVVWAPMSRDVMGFLRQMGLLEGMSNLSTSRNLEILPTFAAVQVGTLDGSTGAFNSADTQEVGLNVKYGLTSNLTFDFTYNPDFSQIESDRHQIEVNLRFPVNYPELRPFFVEGQDIFRIMGPVSMVHTRTIVDPQMGAKLTGKVGRTTVGFVVANDQAPGRVGDRLHPAFEQTAQVVLARVKYNLRSESHVGGLFTDREFLNSHSRLVGYDAQFRIGKNHRLGFMGGMTDHRDLAGVQKTGNIFDVNFRKEGRNLSYLIAHYDVDPDVRTDLGFVRRVDQKNTVSNVTYRWWPESWIINWGPRINYDRNYDYRGNLQDQLMGMTLNAEFARNISVSANVNRDLERYREVTFVKQRFNFSGRVNSSRRISFSGEVNGGDEIRFIANPYLGSTTGYKASMTLRPFSRLQSAVDLDSNRFIDVRNNAQVFDIKILRAQTTYQFTDRLLVRNIIDRNTFDKTLGANVLLTYRVNSGTAFYVGYDDRYRQEDQIASRLLPGAMYRRTNRAFFTKLQYLFRY